MHVPALNAPAQIPPKQLGCFCAAPGIAVLLRLLEPAIHPSAACFGNHKLCIPASDLQLYAESRFVSIYS